MMRPLHLASSSALALSLLAAPMIALPMIALPLAPAAAQIGIGIGFTVRVAPPALPVYVPPPLPGPGYLWTPGYWAYGDDGYYWVPGTWVEPPQPGLLWTPGYWGWNNGIYAFNAGYWGPHVGYYGGIDYGYGYNGFGFFGGEWRGGVFAYNRAAGYGFGGVHINVYDRSYQRFDNHVSFNGPHGVNVRPTPQQMAWAHERHVGMTPGQQTQMHMAASNPQLRASFNHGHPPIAATARPGDFHGGAVPARPMGAMTPHAAIAEHHEVQQQNHMVQHQGMQEHRAVQQQNHMIQHHNVQEHRAMAPREAAHPAMAPHAMAPHAMAHPQARPAAHPAPQRGGEGHRDDHGH